MKVIDYIVLDASDVKEYLGKGYQPYGGLVYDHQEKLLAQAMVKYDSAEEPGFSGGMRPAVQATQDLSDTSLDLVVDKVYDIDGNELKVGDRVLIIEGVRKDSWFHIIKIDPIFSKVYAEGESMGYSSVEVRLEWGPR